MSDTPSIVIDPNLVLDERCASMSHPWSIPDLALPNSQLSGVLAGFMVLGIVTLLFQRDRAGRGFGHTIALFGAGTLVLGIDSYLFGSVAASKPTEGHDFAEKAQACRVAWIQIMPAAGMLALGAGLLAAGIGWMMTRHAVDANDTKKQHSTLGNILAGLALGGSASLLMYTTWSFSDHMAGEFFRTKSTDKGVRAQLDGSGGTIPAITEADQVTAHYTIGWVGAVLALLLISSIVPKTFMLWKRMEKNPAWDQVTFPRHRVTEWIAGLSALYVFTSLFAIVVLPGWRYVWFLDITEAHFRHFWITPRYQLWWGLILGLMTPAVLFVLIAVSMPGPFGMLRLAAKGLHIRCKYHLHRDDLRTVTAGEIMAGDVIHEIASGDRLEVVSTTEAEAFCKLLYVKDTTNGHPRNDARTYPDDYRLWREQLSSAGTYHASDEPTLGRVLLAMPIIALGVLARLKRRT